MKSLAPQQDERAETRMSRLLAFIREQPGQTALLVMAVIGLGISIYLTIVHYDSNVPLVCNTSGLVSCQSVTTSAYSVIPGTTIPITIPGMLWFLALGALAGMGLRWAARGEAEDPRLRITTLLLTVAGLAFVLYLVYCEIVLVQRICEWCTVIHLLTLASLVIALTRWQRRNDPAVARAPRAISASRAAQSNRSASIAHSGAHGRTATLSRRARRSLSHRSPAGR
ncbi:MAG TPA: vitamin K epoxide reductase family protein [Ktedonobacterales bacterium]|nr:vitamin K epoxide reductase family protein [Ktedonobacterales bacterium]